MSDDLVKRLRDWEHVWIEDADKPEGSLYLTAADRIEELEAELAEYKHVASAIDTQWAESQDEIADLKGKLDLAVVYLSRIERLSLHYTQPEKLEGLYRHAHGTTRHIAKAAIAKLTSSEAANGEAKGGKDE